MKKLIFVLLVLSMASAAPARAKAPKANVIAIVGVSVIPMDGERVLPGQTVIIRDGLIESIGDAGRIKVPADASRIDGAGRFLVPGLWDMHVHLTLTGDLAFPVLLANGVTAVRDMGGDLKKIDDWRRQIEGGQKPGPFIVRAGLYVDGPKDAADRLVITDEDEARRAVSAQKARGVDFIKIHNAVPRNAFFVLLEEAKKQGLSVAGHIPLDITPLEATAAGQKSFEHMTSLIEGAMTRDVKAGKSPAQSVMAFSDDVAAQLFREMAKNGTWMTPTLIAEQAITLRAEIEANPDARAQYVPSELKKYWLEAFAGKPTAARKVLFQRYLALVKLMHRESVRILAGTDLGLRDVYPGFSLHDELELLVKAGPYSL